MTVRGADVTLRDDDAWGTVWGQTTAAAGQYGLGCFSVVSNFREMLDEPVLARVLAGQGTPGEWWHEIQHGIGIASLAAPLAFALGCPTVYIAATFSESDPKDLVCASYPCTDGRLSCCHIATAHDGFDLNKQAKADLIVDFAAGGVVAHSYAPASAAMTGRTAAGARSAAEPFSRSSRRAGSLATSASTIARRS